MTTLSFEPARENMIYQQVRPWDVVDSKVLNTLQSVPREQFVPDNFRQLAFADTEIPLPCGQSMLKPIVEGRLLQALSARPTDRTLLIGTGSGFLTACVAALTDHVISMDIHAELTEMASVRLTDEKVRNAELLTADFNDYTPHGQFDRILVTGAMPVFDPRLPEWLTEDGLMLLFTGSAPNMEAELVTRSGNTYTRKRLFETVVSELINTMQPATFQL